MDTVQVALRGERREPDWIGLLRAIAAKDADALADLYSVCRKSVFAMAYAVTRDRQLAEDVLQETMLYIWTHADRFRFGSHPRLWIGMIARHLAIDLVRRNRSWVPLDAMQDDTREAIPARQEDLDGNLSLWEGIYHLDSLEAQVFVCKAVLGLGHAETARLMEITYRSVNYQYRKAVRKLRVALSDGASPDGRE